jgi:F0F1-type ATP synthase membrane subunit a
MIFDLFFGAIQAVVFTLLSCVFIGQKVDEEELIVE